MSPCNSLVYDPTSQDERVWGHWSYCASLRGRIQTCIYHMTVKLAELGTGANVPRPFPRVRWFLGTRLCACVCSRWCTTTMSLVVVITAVVTWDMQLSNSEARTIKGFTLALKLISLVHESHTNVMARYVSLSPPTKGKPKYVLHRFFPVWLRAIPGDRQSLAVS